MQETRQLADNARRAIGNPRIIMEIPVHSKAFWFRLGQTVPSSLESLQIVRHQILGQEHYFTCKGRKMARTAGSLHRDSAV